MRDANRVQEWRKRLRDEGKAPVTVWLSREEKRRLDVHFISSQPVMQRLACKAWADKRPVQIVWAVRKGRPDHDVVDDACG